MRSRINSKGQVTIPHAIRAKAGLLPHTDVELDLDADAVRIRPVRRTTIKGSGAALIAHMRGRGDVRMTTDEIMALTRE